jgi:hypothetical protein
MHHITHPRSRRFLVAVAATLTALLMVAVSSAVNSAHSQTTSATNAGKAFSGFHDNPIGIPFLGTGKLVTLKIPVAGSYVVNAKLVAVSKAAEGTTGSCKLSAGNDFDEVEFAVANRFGSDKESLALQIVHTFGSPGSVTLSCNNLTFNAAEARDTKITAVQVGQLTNTPI